MNSDVIDRAVAASSPSMAASDDRTDEMRRRLLRHLGTTVLGFVVALVAAAILGGVAVAVDASPAVRRGLSVVTVFSALTIALGVGWTSTVRNLRCPACDTAVWWLASMNTSAFASRAPKRCPTCRVQLFAENRSKRTVIALAIVAIALVAAGAAMSVLTQR